MLVVECEKALTQADARLSKFARKRLLQFVDSAAMFEVIEHLRDPPCVLPGPFASVACPVAHRLQSVTGSPEGVVGPVGYSFPVPAAARASPLLASPGTQSPGTQLRDVRGVARR